jgi:hypothetical protein
VELRVRVAVEMGEEDPVRRHAPALEQVDDLVPERADLRVDEHSRAGPPGGDRAGLETPPLRG